MSSSILLQPYELPLVRYDLHESETMKDVLFSIESLAVSMDDIFSKLQGNVTSERKRLANIHQRLAVCQQKVKAFKGSKRPTTVFSTARFPGNLNDSPHPTVIMASESALVSTSGRDMQYL